MVVDAEVVRDPADGAAALEYRGSVRRDRLVDGRLKGLEKLSLNRNLGDGANPLRTCEPQSQFAQSLLGSRPAMTPSSALSLFRIQSRPRVGAL